MTRGRILQGVVAEWQNDVLEKTALAAEATALNLRQTAQTLRDRNEYSTELDRATVGLESRSIDWDGFAHLLRAQKS